MRRTPQAKKALSYAKDRRNVYGENDKSSRRNITLRKARQRRSFRKNANQLLQGVIGAFDEKEFEIVENKLRILKRKDWWGKIPDVSLGEFVQRKLERRKNDAGKGKTARKKIREVLKELEIEVEETAGGRWIAMAANLSNVSADGETREKAVSNLRYLVRAAVANVLGFDTRILVDEKFIKPIL